jgi:hypothetical protein
LLGNALHLLFLQLSRMNCEIRGLLRRHPTSAGFLFPYSTPCAATVTASHVQHTGSWNTDGIVWAIERIRGASDILQAYDASDLAKELYNANQVSNDRDHFGQASQSGHP